MTCSQTKECINDIGRDGLEKLIDRLGEDCVSAGLSLGILPENIEEAYAGSFTSDTDFAYDMAEQLGELPKDNRWPHYCIDWEYAAKELMMDYGEEGGFYFRNM
jgi:hypothetical protein